MAVAVLDSPEQAAEVQIVPSLCTKTGKEGTVVVQGPNRIRVDKYDVRLSVLAYAADKMGLRNPGISSSALVVPGWFDKEGRALKAHVEGAEVRAKYEVTGE
jgi:hypothetical protein